MYASAHILQAPTELTESPGSDIVLLNARDLCRAFDQTTAVSSVSLSLRKGEVTGFLGVNGAGKTTTMRMLCGTLAPDSGEITILGANLLTEPQTARASIGFLPDTPPLYPELTVDEYLIYCAALRRVHKSQLNGRIAGVKQQTGLADRSTARISSLSRGYRQRLGIAQAIIHQPSIVILDEPTSGLDPVQIEEIRQLIRSLASDSAVLLSTHLLAEARAVCDRVIIIHDGRIVHESSVDDALETTFFGITCVAAA